MATTTESTRRGAARNGTKDAIEESRALAREAGLDAQEALSRSIKISVDTANNVSEVWQQLARHVVDLSLASTQEAFRLWPELASSAIDGWRAALDRWPINVETVGVFQRVLDGSTDAFSRYTRIVQTTAEEGTERIGQAVNDLTERVQDSSREVGEMGKRIEQNRTGRSSASRPVPAGASSSN